MQFTEARELIVDRRLRKRSELENRELGLAHRDPGPWVDSLLRRSPSRCCRMACPTGSFSGSTTTETSVDTDAARTVIGTLMLGSGTKS